MKNKNYIYLVIFTLFIIIGVIPVYAQDYLGVVLGVKKSKGEVMVGKVDKVQENKVTVKDQKTNKNVDVTVDPLTKLLDKTNKQLKLEQVKVKDKVAVISEDDDSSATLSGTPDSSSPSGKPKKKVVKIYFKSASESAQLKRNAVMGVISEIEGGVITLTHQIQTERTYKIIYTADTIIKTKDATASAQLQVGQRIVAVGTSDGAGVITAKLIHVIPGKATGVLKKYPTNVPKPTVKLSITPNLSITPVLTTTPSASIAPTSEPEPTLEPEPTEIPEGIR